MYLPTHTTPTTPTHQSERVLQTGLKLVDLRARIPQPLDHEVLSTVRRCSFDPVPRNNKSMPTVVTISPMFLGSTPKCQESPWESGGPAPGSGAETGCAGGFGVVLLFEDGATLRHRTGLNSLRI